MKRPLGMIGTMTLLLLAIGVVAAQAEPQFTGAWVLDRSQSQLPAHQHRGHDAQAEPAEVKLLVAQQGTALKVTRTMTMGTRERSMTDSYVADGTDQTRQSYRGNVVTRAAFDGDRLVITRTHTKQGDQSQVTRSQESIWTLSPDGNILTIDTTLHGTRGDRSLKTVYVRS